MQKAWKVNINIEMIASVNVLIRGASIIELIRKKKQKKAKQLNILIENIEEKQKEKKALFRKTMIYEI